MLNRITHEHIESLREGQIFVFGSNEAGRHGKGAAKQAVQWGAKYGTGYGLAGNTWAIPTKDYNMRTLGMTSIEGYVNGFIDFVKSNPECTYLVTKVGCGLAGYQPEQIAPLFKECINLEQVYLPEDFWKILLGNGN